MIIRLNLSLFYKVLLFIEDRGEVEISELRQLGSRRQVFGALGRLRSLGYVNRIKTNTTDVLVLAPEGDEAIATLLNLVPQPNETWDEKWRMILFDLPESKNPIRQLLRLKLIDFGARKLESGVWITPRQVIADRFIDFVTTHGYGSYVHFFEATSLPPHPIDITVMWQLDTLHRQYIALLKQFDKLTHDLDSNPHPSYMAKCMILALALIAKKDPVLPEELLPYQWGGTQAYEWYKKLRVIANSQN